MVGDRSFQYVDHAWPVSVVVDRAEDTTRLDGHHPHSKLAACHALDLRAKVNRCQQIRRDTFRLRCRLFVAHLLSSLFLPWQTLLRQR
jgi:butyrate kinase